MTGEPLNAKEAALWLFQVMNPSAVMHVPVAFRTADRTLRWWPMKVAVDHLVAAQPALRTVFADVDGTPVRKILDAYEVEIETLTTSAEALADDLAAFARRPFRFTEEPLFRVGHFTGDPAGDVVCFTCHHIIADAQSCAVLLGTFMEIYESVAAGRPVPEKFSRPVEPFREPAASEVDLGFWRNHLAGADEAARPMSITEPGPPDDYHGRQVSAPVSEATSAAVERASKELNASPSIVLLSIFYILLANHGAGHDLVVGVPLDTRPPHRRDSVGYHVNIVGLRARLDPAMTFRDWVRKVRDTFLDGLRHLQASVDEAVPGSYDTASQWRQPLIRHMFNYSPYSADLSARFGLQVLPVQLGYSRVDLTCSVLPRGTDMLIVATYREQQFPSIAVRRLIDRYLTLLDACLADMDRPLLDYPLWSDADRAGSKKSTMDVAALAPELSSVDLATVTVRDWAGRELPPGVWGELHGADGAIGLRGRWGWSGAMEVRSGSDVPPLAVDAENVGTAGDEAITAMLVDLWRQLLDRPDTNEHTHFFEAGGTSLKAARVVAGIRNQLGVTVKLRQVFATPTPAGLAAAITAAGELTQTGALGRSRP